MTNKMTNKRQCQRWSFFSCNLKGLWRAALLAPPGPLSQLPPTDSFQCPLIHANHLTNSCYTGLLRPHVCHAYDLRCLQHNDQLHSQWLGFSPTAPPCGSLRSNVLPGPPGKASLRLLLEPFLSVFPTYTHAAAFWILSGSHHVSDIFARPWPSVILLFLALSNNIYSDANHILFFMVKGRKRKERRFQKALPVDSHSKYFGVATLLPIIGHVAHCKFRSELHKGNF